MAAGFTNVAATPNRVPMSSNKTRLEIAATLQKFERFESAFNFEKRYNPAARPTSRRNFTAAKRFYYTRTANS
jgi:hypothetical protein